MLTLGGWRIPMPVQVDAYQATHFQQIPPGMENFQLSQGIYRKPLPFGGERTDQRVVSAGVAPFISQFLDQVITAEDIEEGRWFYQDFNAGGTPFPWPQEMFERIVRDYSGRFPIVIDALFDGQAHFVGEPHIQIWTEEPGMGESVGWIESSLGPYLWPMSVVATRGRMRLERMMEVFRKAYPSKPEEEIRQIVQYRCHDFGRRGGANSLLTGIAHLYNFLGTDTDDAAYTASRYLNDRKKFGAGSIPAWAHRTVTPWPLEEQAIQRAMDLYKGGVFAFVADTYDYERAIRKLGSHAAAIQTAGGFLVGRTDSGDHVENILLCLRVFAEVFGTTTQEAGLMEIKNAGCIDGDGVSDELLFETLYPAILKAGFSPINLAIGMGEHNHKALRSETEWGYKTASVGEDGSHLQRPAMKRSADPFKRSIPGAVALDFSGASSGFYSGRVRPLTIEGLRARQTGDLHRLYDGRPQRGEVERETFTGTRERAWRSWKQLPLQPPGDTFDPTIRQMQDEYMRRMTG